MIEPNPTPPPEAPVPSRTKTAARGKSPAQQAVRRRRTGRLLLVSAGLLALLFAGGGLWLRGEARASLPDTTGELRLAGLSAPVTLARDAHGVAAIAGADRLDVAFATGFAHAQDRFFQMDLLRRKAAGESAELLGPALLEEDRAIRRHRLRVAAGALLARTPPAHRALLAAYTAGVNAGLAELSAAPAEYLLLRSDPAPWRIEDSLLVQYAMFCQLQDWRAVYETGLGLMRDLLRPGLIDFLVPRATPWDAPVAGEPGIPVPVPRPEVLDLRGRPARPVAARLDGDPEAAGPGFPAGSNLWAVAGAHTADGRALLANDLHLGLTVPNTWYQATLSWPGHRLAGFTLPGSPLLVLGSNGSIAWGYANSLADTVDVVRVDPAPGAPGAYRTPDGPRRFETFREVIRVRGGEEEVLDVRSTIWGPMIAPDHRGRPRAVRWIATSPGAVNLDLLDLESAAGVEQAIAVAHRSGVPAQSFVVADAAGRIGWTIIGFLPRRVGFDGRLDGSWADGTRRWDGLLPAAEVPQVVDPAGGRLWAANNRVVTGEGLARLGDGGYYLAARARQIRDQLFALERATAADMQRIQLDDRALAMEPWRKLFLAALTADTVVSNAGRAEARRLVESWDGRATVDSVGYRLVRAFRLGVGRRALLPLTEVCRRADPTFDYYTVVLEEEYPLVQLATQQPLHLLNPGYRSWQQLFLEVIDVVLADLARYGPLSERVWGEVNTLRMFHPLRGALPGLGRLLDMEGVQVPGDSNMPRLQHPSGGASVRLVVSPGREEAAAVQMPGGQSGHPLSPHYADLLDEWVSGTPLPLLAGAPVETLRLVPAGAG